MTWSPGNGGPGRGHKTRFCPRGHDTEVVGRYNGNCRQCKSEDRRDAYRATYAANPAHEIWKRNRRRLRARIAAKRVRVAELEAQLEELTGGAS